MFIKTTTKGFPQWTYNGHNDGGRDFRLVFLPEQPRVGRGQLRDQRLALARLDLRERQLLHTGASLKTRRRSWCFC